MPMTVAFLSHSSKDKSSARRIARRLGHRGVQVWLDENELRLGDRLPSLLRDRIAATPFFLVLATDAARDSRWVALEIDAAQEAGESTVVPLFPAGLVPWGRLANVKGLTLDPLSFEGTMDALAGAILGATGVDDRDPELLRRDFRALATEHPELARAVEASVSDTWRFADVAPADHDAIETMLWIAYELADTTGRARIAGVAAELFRRHGLGYELVARSLAGDEDHGMTLNALCQNIGRPELITPAFRLLDRLAAPSDLHFRWLVTNNVEHMSERQLDVAVRYTTRPIADEESSVERMFLADFLYRRRPNDDRLQSFWVQRAYWATPYRPDDLRVLVLTLTDAIATGRFQYDAAVTAFRSRARNLARSSSLPDRCAAVELLQVARHNGYPRFDELVSELDVAPGSAEWKSPETDAAFGIAYRHAVRAIAEGQSDAWDAISRLAATAVPTR